MAVVESQSVADLCRAASVASRALARVDTATKNAAILAIADALQARSAEIIEANARDLEAGRAAGLSEALMDRLMLDDARVTGIADGARAVAALADPVGAVLGGGRLANGLQVSKVRVPLGVIAVVYESRPNVTIDCAALCLKSGNAIVLRGSSSAIHSNTVLTEIVRDAVASAGLPAAAVSLVAGGGRAELAELATQREYVDLIIPRGGEGLKKALMDVATVPVIYAAAGVCHVYVDESADVGDAVAIAVNAKAQRPSACNAAETLLVHADIAGAYLPLALPSLRAAGVDPAAGRALARAGRRARRPRRASSPTGRRSTCRSISPCASWTRWTRRSSTSRSTAPATPRRSSPAR